MSPAFSAEETAAMRETAAERREAAKREKASNKAALDLQDVLDKIAEMPAWEATIATRIHEIVLESAPHLLPKTWYGMPAYANAEGKVVCFFKPASKFGSRYCTFGFEEAAQLDEESIWVSSWAILALTTADEKLIGETVARAAAGGAP